MIELIERYLGYQAAKYIVAIVVGVMSAIVLGISGHIRKKRRERNMARINAIDGSGTIR